MDFLARWGGQKLRGEDRFGRFDQGQHSTETCNQGIAEVAKTPKQRIGRRG